MTEQTGSGRQKLWAVAGLLALVLAGVVAAFAVRAAQRRQAAELIVEARAALDRGDAATAESRLRVAAQKDPEAAGLGLERGRLALARDRAKDALTLLRRAREQDPGDTPEAEGRLALALAEAEGRAGDVDRALGANDHGLARLSDVLDGHLDQDGLGSDGRPVGGGTLSPAAAVGLDLLAQRGRLAARRGLALHEQGDDAAALKVLEAGETRLSGTTCTGTHRVYCRGARAEVRARVMAPIRSARTRLRIDKALKMVADKRFDDALEQAREAHDEAEEAAKKGPTPASRAMARDATQVEYAVRVACGQQAEKQRDWKDAREHFEAADKLWAKGPLDGVALEQGKPPHKAGLARTRTLTGLLDETDSTLDKAAALLAPVGGDALGDKARKRFHDALEARPLDPRTYAEEALTRVRAARVANSDAVVLSKVQSEAERYLDASEKVVPGDPMGRFYKGVLAFMAGYPKRGLDAMKAAYKAGYSGRAASLYLAESLSLRDKHGDALAYWRAAYKADPTDTYVGRRTVEALIASGKLPEARKLVLRLLEERALDRDLIEAQVLVFLHAKDHDNLRRVLQFDEMHFGKSAPEPVKHSRKIAAAVYNKLGDRVHSELLRPGEEFLDRIYGYAIPVSGPAKSTQKRIQCALLVLTTNGLVLLRWDASKDYGAEIERGARLVKRAAHVGTKLGGELAGLSLGDGIGKLVQLLDLLPHSKAARKESLLDSSVGLVIDSLALYDTLRTDLETSVKPEDIRTIRLPKGSIVAWELLPVDTERGLYALSARTRDGLSPWKTEGDRLLVQTHRPARLRAYLQYVLQAK